MTVVESLGAGAVDGDSLGLGVVVAVGACVDVGRVGCDPNPPARESN